MRKIPMDPRQVNSNQLSMRASDLAPHLGVSQMTLWRWRQTPDFPKPKKTISGGKMFLLDDIRAYFESLPEAE